MCTAEAHLVGDHCVNRAGLLPGQEKQNMTWLAREGGVCKAMSLGHSQGDGRLLQSLQSAAA